MTADLALALALCLFAAVSVGVSVWALITSPKGDA